MTDNGQSWHSSAEVRRMLGIPHYRLSYLVLLMTARPRKVGGSLVWTDDEVAELRRLDESTPRKPRKKKTAKNS